MGGLKDLLRYEDTQSPLEPYQVVSRRNEMDEMIGDLMTDYQMNYDCFYRSKLIEGKGELLTFLRQLC